MSPAKSSTYGNQSFHVSSSKWFRVLKIDFYKYTDYFALKNTDVYGSHYNSHSTFSLRNISITKNKVLWAYQILTLRLLKKSLQA